MTTNTKTIVKSIYRIVPCEKSEYGKEISLNEDWNVHIDLKSIEDAKTAAKLAGFESYSIFQYDLDEHGYSHSFSDKSVYVTADVEQWKAIVKKQNERNTKALDEAIERVNALPKKVTVYKDKEFNVTAERNDWTKSYNGSDVKYRLTITLKGKELSSGWRGYQSEGYGKGRKILKKKFAQDVYEATNPRVYGKQSWDEWKETLKNLPLDYVQKYGTIIEKIYENLEKYQQTIYTAKNGQ